MPKRFKKIYKKSFPLLVGVGVCVALFVCAYAISSAPFFRLEYRADAQSASTSTSSQAPKPIPVLDKLAYDAKLNQNAHVVLATTTASTTATSTVPARAPLWPVKTVYPNAGALLPFNRIIAYYGNFYSKGMGVLGEYPADIMKQKLAVEVAKWNAADPTTPVIPAIDYIAVTAQASAGKDGKYRLRMPDSQIDYALELAKQVNGIVILDVQVGLSTLHEELPQLQKYLAMPQVHLAIDPEFAMHGGVRPGRVIGSFDAADINYAANFLATLVQDNNLPPKILVVHRFTQDMVTHYKQITPLPEVQIVMDMDGWGSPAKKIGTYTHVIASEPVQFTGFKLFYKNDLFAPSTRIMSPEELLELTPQPLFIQFQ